MLLAASALFTFQLDASSLFIDEVFSWRASRGSFADMVEAWRFVEVAPPLYYVLLHGWMSLAGDSELAMRLPSVVAGVALVAAVHWLGGLVGGRRAALVAAGLAAASPLILVYAQQARAYVWTMLAVTVAVAAAIEADRRASRRWLALAGVAATLAMLLHYTALLVLAPLAVWVWLRADIARATRIAFGAAIAVPLLALAPLALEQLSQNHHSNTGLYASLTSTNALRLAGTPFDGRVLSDLTLIRELAALVVIESVALLAFAERFRSVRERWLIVVCGLLPIAAVLLVSAAVEPMAITRYTAVATPFLLVAIGVVAVHMQRPVAVALIGAAALASAFGIVASVRPDGRFSDTRGAVTTAAEGWRSGDMLVSVGPLSFDGGMQYYTDRLLPRDARDVPTYRDLITATDDNRVFDAALAGRRLWFVFDAVQDPRRLRVGLDRLGYRVAESHEYPGIGRYQLVRAERGR